jgi:hypothetical protein
MVVLAREKKTGLFTSKRLIPTTERGLMKLAQMLGAYAMKCAGLQSADDIDAYMAQDDKPEDGKEEIHPLKAEGDQASVTILPLVSFN